MRPAHIVLPDELRAKPGRKHLTILEAILNASVNRISLYGLVVTPPLRGSEIFLFLQFPS